MWFVSRERSGRFVARAHTADPHGGSWLPGELAADTLETLRAMLPRGLTRRDRTSVMSPEVLEVWDSVPSVVPLSVRLAAFHQSQRDWHLEMARKHDGHGHEPGGLPQA